MDNINLFPNKDLQKLIIKAHYLNILNDICEYLNLNDKDAENIKKEINLTSNDILKL